MISARRAREADLDKADIYLVSGGAIYRWFPAHSRADVAPSTERMIPYAVPAVVRPMGSGYWIRRWSLSSGSPKRDPLAGYDHK